jgi:hypothetical protein
MSASDPVMRSFSEQRYFLLRLRLILVALMVAALILGTARFGLLWSISVMAAVNTLHALVVALRVGKVLQVKWEHLSLLRDVGKVGLASLGAGIATLFIRLLQLESKLHTLIASVVVFGVVYIILISLFKVVTVEERTAIRRALTRLHTQIFSKFSSQSAETN